MRTFHKISISGMIAFALLAKSIFAQGNGNPTGITGQFYGDITTGCNYDPFTADARRGPIIDLLVAGAVGAYPLAFTRTSTSRYIAGPAIPMGAGGSWRHSYQWSIEDSSSSGIFTVNYPDGRRVTFTPAENMPFHYTAVGIRDRIRRDYPFGYASLVLADGGKVQFSFVNGGGTYKYTLRKIVDPYGQTTNITYPADGNTLITEPAGRWIKIFFRTITQASEGVVGDKIIDHVSASDGRSVQYTYTAYTDVNQAAYTTLIQATYFGDPTLKAIYTYKPNNIFGVGRPLLATCDDPMYAGPMKKISYAYVDAVYMQPPPNAGQILSEKSGTTSQVVSSLSLGLNGYFPIETRADGKTRSFSYGPNQYGFTMLINWTDFKGVTMSQTYDTKSFVNSFTDSNGNTTNWTNDPISGRPLTITYPLTPNDTPPGTPRGTVTYTYGWATCPDPNNRDATAPYYLYSVTDEGVHATMFTRDTSKRITRIDYPDGGYETFTYNSFGQVLTHLMKTGGTESFSYDARGLKLTYRDAYHQTGNPTAWYQYDALDRVSGVTDALGSASGDINHTTNYSYNSRGQLLVTTHPPDPIDGQRHTIQNAYNSNGDGTLVSVTDQLSHITSFTYDDYRRVRSVTSPGHNTPVTGYTYYDANGTGEDYSHTDANVTHATAPGSEKTTNVYDENYRKTSTIVGDGTPDAAKTSYGYDNNGNVTSVISPNEQPGQPYAGKSTITAYDERNRVMSVTDALINMTTFKYDAAGRKASVTRPNGQVITYDSYDAMNRLLQQTMKQTPDPDAVTKYTYYTSGLLHTMQDPRLVANNSPYLYDYVYDQMGRKTNLTYPPDSVNVERSEIWHYDIAGRRDTFTNRDNKMQTIVYDALNRVTNLSWNDSGMTPSVSFGYDAANRTTSIVNANATIARTYFNDNLLNTERTTYADNTARTVTYTYNADGNRATIQYPNAAYSFTYNYTARNQVKTLVNNSGGATVMTYGYDPDGNLATRTPANSTNSTYSYDALDRVTNISHALNGTTRTFGYAYDSVSNRKWVKRDGGNGDVFGYDLNDQSIAILLNIANPDTTPVGAQTINYDANGNRTTFSAYGPTDTYTTNNLNQYTVRNSNQASYDPKGNMTTGVDTSTYTYDAQNRLLTATKGGTTEFKYDGLNRQVSRQIGGNPVVYNVYDGWNLIGEYASGSTSPSAAYLSGAGGLVKNLTTNRYYYQDASGSTSHLASNTGALFEWYRYDLQGTPTVYDPSNNVRTSGSIDNVRHLFTGQQWYREIGLYDLRNRFYSPDIGRFLQADPIGFNGDPTNLYRYCRNNPLIGVDPLGLDQWTVGVGFFGGLMYTWGTNGGQSNWGIYGGFAFGFAVSYRASDSGASSPGTVPGIASGISASTSRASVNVNYSGTTRGANLTITGGPKTGYLGSRGGVNVDQAGNLSAVGPTFSFGRFAFWGIGGTQFGDLPISFQNMSDGNIASVSNGSFDAVAVEQEFTSAVSAFQDPSAALISAAAPFGSANLSIASFGGMPLGIGTSLSGSSFAFGSSLSSLNYTGPPSWMGNGWGGSAFVNGEYVGSAPSDAGGGSHTDEPLPKDPQ